MDIIAVDHMTITHPATMATINTIGTIGMVNMISGTIDMADIMAKITVPTTAGTPTPMTGTVIITVRPSV
jgi:hypothetical protein